MRGKGIFIDTCKEQRLGKQGAIPEAAALNSKRSAPEHILQLIK
jgi:hypothetical protein